MGNVNIFIIFRVSELSPDYRIIRMGESKYSLLLKTWNANIGFYFYLYDAD